MTTLNSALNYSFASSEAVRLVFAERGAEDVVATQLRQAAEQTKFPAGSTITARYQYKVAEDGSLVPVQTQITTEAARDDGRNAVSRRSGRQNFRRDENERPPNFSDITNPKARLAPADEAALFAVINAENSPGTGVAAQTLPRVLSLFNPAVKPATAEVVDEDGELIEAESVAPPSGRTELAVAGSAGRGQFLAANLYARNNDIVYNVTPIAQLAA